MKRVSGGHSSKTTFSPVFFPWFSSRFGRKKLVGPGEKFFSRVFHPLYFPPYAKQWKTHFSTPFSLLYFPPLLKSIQPNTLSELGFGEGEEKFLGAFVFYLKFLGIGVLILTIMENSLFLAEIFPFFFFFNNADNDNYVTNSNEVNKKLKRL